MEFMIAYALLMLGGAAMALILLWVTVWACWSLIKLIIE
jgi:hypothetical protein